MTKADKEGLSMIGVSTGLLFCCICMYYLTGIGRIWNYQFPTNQVLLSIPVSLLMWGICAVFDNCHTDKISYRNVYAFIGCNIFGCTVMTACFLFLSGK